MPSMYIFPVGIDAWLAFAAATILCLASAGRAAISCTKGSLSTAAAYASAFMLSLSLLFLCLDLPLLAAGQLLQSSITAIILLYSAKIADKDESNQKPTLPQRKIKATVTAATFLFLNGTAIWLSTPLFEAQLHNSGNTLIFSQTDYAFRLESYEALENISALTLRILLHYPYLTSIVFLAVSILSLMALMLSSKQLSKTETEK